MHVPCSQPSTTSAENVDAAHRAAFPVMGTTASVHVNDDIDDSNFDTCVAAVRTELDRWESMFSVFRPDSEISRINDGSLHLLDASREVIEVIDSCTWLEQSSQGAFSIRQSTDSAIINPSGFVKGWAGERAARLLREQGLSHVYIGIGGDFMAFGGLTDDEPWHIGIIDPRDTEQLVGTVDIIDGAVATSGTAERGRHIWDPRSGRPAGTFLSVTVTGPSLMWADAFATTVFVMGDAGLEWLNQFPGYDAMVVRATPAD
jgi:thiamine biosynthesis lipoprotein